ncbi:MAG TPA: hypothetical protein VEQ40_02205, partial [Pyrinomonadaceae bacterium]|nr:hypothetical protein [Pyrinomonadaceae bacterium]
MKKALLYSLLALLSIYSSATGRAFQEGNASAVRTAQAAPQAEQPCVGNSGEKLENKDAEANSFTESINSFTAEVVRVVEAAPNPSEGLDEAQKLMDAQKQALHAQFFIVGNSKRCQFSKQVQKKMEDSFYQDGMKVGQLHAKYGIDPAVRTKLQKLTQDFLEIFKKEGKSQGDGDGRAGDMRIAEDSPKPDPCASRPGEQSEKKEAEIKSFV